MYYFGEKATQLRKNEIGTKFIKGQRNFNLCGQMLKKKVMEIRKIQGSKMGIENLKKKGLHLKIYHFNNLKLKLKENSTRIMF